MPARAAVEPPHLKQQEAGNRSRFADEYLMTQVQGGDTEALGELYDRPPPRRSGACPQTLRREPLR